MKNQNWTFFRTDLFHMKTRVFLEYFVNDYLWNHFFFVELAPDLFKFALFDNFCNSKVFDTVLI